jgi:hypothetical protein
MLPDEVVAGAAAATGADVDVAGVVTALCLPY